MVELNLVALVVGLVMLPGPLNNVLPVLASVEWGWKRGVSGSFQSTKTGCPKAVMGEIAVAGYTVVVERAAMIETRPDSSSRAVITWMTSGVVTRL